jgi:hypothetical protein
MRKEPAGTAIMAGQLSHSLKPSFGFSARSDRRHQGQGRGRLGRGRERGQPPALLLQRRNAGLSLALVDAAGKLVREPAQGRDVSGALEVAPGDLIGAGSGCHLWRRKPARRHEIERAVDRRARHPGLLHPLGGALHLQPDLVERIENAQAGLADGVRERPRIGAVAGGAVLRDAAGLGGKGDQSALGGLHLRKPAAGVAHPIVLGVAGAPDREAPPAERVVAAGIEDDDVELGAGALHLAQHQIGGEHLEVDVGLLGRVGVDRNEIVLATDLHAVARIIEQPDIGARQLRPEGLHGAVEGGLVEIELRAPAHHREAEALQGIGQELGVVGGIVQPPHIAIGRIADHQRDALVGERRRRDKARQERRQPSEQRQSSHQRTPLHACAASLARPASRMSLIVSPQPRAILARSGAATGFTGISHGLARLFKHNSRQRATAGRGGGTLIFRHARVNTAMSSLAQESGTAAPACARPGRRRSCGLRPVRSGLARDWG